MEVCAPFTPDELLEDGKSIPATGTLLIGDKGTILNNELIPAKKTREYPSAEGLPGPQGDREAAAGCARPNVRGQADHLDACCVQGFGRRRRATS